MAIAHGEVDKALKIIQSGQCDINSPDASGNCPLHTALHYDQLDIAKTLLGLRCKVNEPEEVTNLYPIHIAAHKTSPECLDLLLEYNDQLQAGSELTYIDLDIRDDTSCNTALGLAARAGHYDIVHRLVAAGCELDTVNVSGDCPLYLAILHGHGDIVQLLLEQGASLEMANRGRKESDLPYSCLYSHDDGQVLRVLLEHGQNPNVFSAEGRTPLMYALTWEQHAMLEVLLSAHLKDSVGLDVVTPDTQETALFMALRTAGRSPSRLQYVRTLLQRGADVNHTSRSGLQPLDIAVMNNSPAAVEILLEAGAAIFSSSSSSTYRRRRTVPPLVLCAQQGYEDVAGLLVLYGAPLNAHDYTGESPMYAALRNNHLHLVELLIEAGCNLSSERWLGEQLTPQAEIRAVFAKHPELLSRLQALAASPAWLSQLCRTTIRQHLQKNNVPLFKILDLKQPSAIKNFLLCTASTNVPRRDF